MKVHSVLFAVASLVASSSGFVVVAPTNARSMTFAIQAKSKEEDLELTRKVIMESMGMEVVVEEAPKPKEVAKPKEAAKLKEEPAPVATAVATEE
ncbi:hypothetical protein ACA910_005636 [Epithemia clementina (nom. ined.)]